MISTAVPVIRTRVAKIYQRGWGRSSTEKRKGTNTYLIINMLIAYLNSRLATTSQYKPSPPRCGYLWDHYRCWATKTYFIKTQSGHILLRSRCFLWKRRPLSIAGPPSSATRPTQSDVDPPVSHGGQTVSQRTHHGCSTNLSMCERSLVGRGEDEGTIWLITCISISVCIVIAVLVLFCSIIEVTRNAWAPMILLVNKIRKIIAVIQY